MKTIQDHGRDPMKLKITVEDEEGHSQVFEIEEAVMEQTRDFINDYDNDGKRINVRENPANPGVKLRISGRIVRQRSA